MRKHLIIIGGNDSSAVKAAQLDVDITLFQLKKSLTEAQTKAARRVIVCDFEEIDEVLALGRAIHASHPVDAVASFWERALLPAALLGEALGVPTNSSRAVRLTRDKLAMRKVLEATGLTSVRFALCKTPATVARFFKRVKSPVVLKPANGSGSTGVVFIDREKQIESAWKWATFPGLFPLMVEEYIEGPEFSVESLSRSGRHRILGITEKFSTGPPHFIETGHRFPAALDPDVTRRVHQTVKELLTAVDHLVGPAHTEIRIVRGNPVVIETQTRFGGDQIWEMVEMVAGTDLTKATCASLLGIARPPVSPRAGGAAIRFFAYENCRISAISGRDDAARHRGVERVVCKLEAGMQLGPLRNSKGRQGYVLAAGPTSAAAWKVAGEALTKIHLELAAHDAAGDARGSTNGHRVSRTVRRVQHFLKEVRKDEQATAEMLPLTANENSPSKSSRLLTASPLADRYHLGSLFDRLPSRFLLKGDLMIKGFPRVGALEQAAHQAARNMFGAELSDFRPLSGVHTTLCTLALSTLPGDCVYSISTLHGGHFATRFILKHLGRESRYLPWNSENHSWDLLAAARAFARAKPNAILIDHGAALKPIPIRDLRKLAGPRVPILYDASHTFGLIAGGAFPNPLREGCDLLQGNTHKTFPGPQKGMLHFRRWRFGQNFCRALSSGFVSSQHTHHALALYLTMLELEAFGAEYARMVIANAVTLGTELEKRGFEPLKVGGKPTESNLILITRAGDLDMYSACELLFKAGISTNARTLNRRAVLRLGTQEVTRRGMTAAEMVWIADIFYRLLVKRESPLRLRREVTGFTAGFRNIHYSFDREAGLWF